MKKENFITLLTGVVGGLIFALGMCMCLLPEWDAFIPGAVLVAVGMAALVALLVIRRKMRGRPLVTIDKHTLGVVVYCVVSALVMGIGMCMTMVWKGLMVWGIIVGIVGIIMLICLIPIFKRLK